MGDTDDEAHRKLANLLQEMRPFIDLTTSETPTDAWVVEKGSPLDGDNKRTDPYHLSHAAWLALTVAVDHLHCMSGSLMTVTGSHIDLTIYSHGQFSQLRGAFENAARAVWLLGPSNRLERVTRRLAMENKDMRGGYRLRDLVKASHPRPLEKRVEQLEDLLLQAGLQYTRKPSEDEATAKARALKQALKMPTYKEMVRTAGEITGMTEDIAEFVWSSCSALAHGDAAATIGLSNKEVINIDGNNINLVKITASSEGLLYNAMYTCSMIRKAFELFKKRAKAPFRA